jgi:hypothetical protein
MKRRSKASERLRRLVVMALGCAACGGSAAPEQTYAVLIRATDTDGNPLEGLRITLAGRELGATTVAGTFGLQMTGAEGQRIELDARCPEGFKGPRERAILFLRQVRSLDPQAPVQSELLLSCQATHRYAAVVVNTGQPGIPIMLRDQELARTTTQGTAHVVLKEATGSSFRLTLDTRAQAELRPKSPSRIFEVGDQDDFVIWDQPFEKEKPKPVPKPKPKPKPPPPYELFNAK